MKVSLTVLLFLGSASLAIADGPALPEFKTPPIEFVNRHEAYSVASPLPEIVEDRLLIGDITSQQVTFFFFLTGSNLHICSGSGTATKKGNVYYYIAPSTRLAFEQGKLVQKPAECRLRIEFDSKKAALDDEGGNCKEDFCGMRATIDHSTFSKKQ